MTLKHTGPNPLQDNSQSTLYILHNPIPARQLPVG